MASGDTIETIENVENSVIYNTPKEHPSVQEIHYQKDKDAISIERGDSDGKQNVPKSGTNTILRTKAEREKDRERKIGHRRVGVGGEITYKKIQTSQIMGSIQLGIQHAVGGLASKPERDLLMQDFMTVETTTFPSEGSSHTPAHHYSEFKFKNYAPIAFRYFRELFGIQPDDFLMSMCSAPLRELSNPGASGSIFYLTTDDEFIIKTVQHKEGEFLQKLLAGYYMNLNQNPRTLLPKFFGLYCYQCNSKNVRLVIMNNLLPSSVKMHQKYDLKGSTYKRKASKTERQKRSPTFKDLDFMEHHPEGILMEADTYSALVKTIQRDCRVLESFKIMDYSLLVGVHNLDQAQKEKQQEKKVEEALDHELYQREAGEDPSVAMVYVEREKEKDDRIGASSLNRTRSINRQRLVAHSTAMESIQAESEPIDEEEDVPPGGIPARNAKGERLLLFIGIIDILQSYRLKKKLEHTIKSMIHDGDTVSVHNPSFYASRFQQFMANKVFKKIPSPLKHSPSKRKSLVQRPFRGHEDFDNNTTAQVQSSSSQQNGSKTVSPTETAAAKVPPIPSNVPALVTSSPPALTSPPNSSYPAILVGSHSLRSSDHKPKVPPPVPPRGTQKVKRGGTSNGGKGVDISDCSTSNVLHDDFCVRSASTSSDKHDCDRLQYDITNRHVSPTSSVKKRGVARWVYHQSRHFSIDKKVSARGRLMSHHSSQHPGSGRGTYRDDAISISDIKLESRPENKSTLSVESGSSGAGHSSHSRMLAWTPPASVEGSTPTWTEGTPSFTESSSSGDMGCPTTPLRKVPASSLSTTVIHHKDTVENAINCLTTEVTRL